MNLEEKINNDIKQAMLAKEKAKLEALRAVKSALLLAKTEKGGSEQMSEADEISILQKLVKQRKDAAEIYSKGDRSELAENEIFQANIIQEYLPEQMSEEEMESIIKEIIADLNAQSMKDMGKVMGKASQKLAGRADGKKIAEKVKQLLS
jgi:uncharacterized protein